MIPTYAVTNPPWSEDSISRSDSCLIIYYTVLNVSEYRGSVPEIEVSINLETQACDILQPQFHASMITDMLLTYFNRPSYRVRSRAISLATRLRSPCAIVSSCPQIPSKFIWKFSPSSSMLGVTDIRPPSVRRHLWLPSTLDRTHLHESRK